MTPRWGLASPGVPRVKSRPTETSPSRVRRSGSLFNGHFSVCTHLTLRRTAVPQRLPQAISHPAIVSWRRAQEDLCELKFNFSTYKCTFHINHLRRAFVVSFLPLMSPLRALHSVSDKGQSRGDKQLRRRVAQFPLYILSLHHQKPQTAMWGQTDFRFSSAGVPTT